MTTYLEKLRNKSDEEKKRLVKIYAGVGTGIVVVIWILVRLALPSSSTESESPSQFQNTANSFETMLDQGFESVQMTPSSPDPEVSTTETETQMELKSPDVATEQSDFFDQTPAVPENNEEAYQSDLNN